MTSSNQTMYRCTFKMDYFFYSTSSIPFLDVELNFENYEVEMKSKTPKTYEEFKDIFDKFNNRQREDYERKIRIRKMIMKLEDDCED